MSVYTPVSPEELDAWLARYAVGALGEQSPIASGIENTNYFVTTAKGRYVLTLYERLPAEELPFYLNLMAHLARAGIEVPAPIPDRTGRALRHAERQARRPRHACRRRADRRARHRALRSRRRGARPPARRSLTYRAALANRRGPAWWRRRRAQCVRFSTPAQNELLAAELKFQAGFGKGQAAARRHPRRPLPRQRAVRRRPRVRRHRLLLRGDDFLAYDLAITVNDWCVADRGASGDLVPDLVDALVTRTTPRGR